MSFYLTFQILKFSKSSDVRKLVFLPLFINYNYFGYDIKSLKYVDKSIDLLDLRKRLEFKLKNCIVNFKLLNLKEFKTVENDLKFRLFLNRPTISGLEVIMSHVKDGQSQSNDKLKRFNILAFNNERTDDDTNHDTYENNHDNDKMKFPKHKTKESLNGQTTNADVNIDFTWSIKFFNFNTNFLLNQPPITQESDYKILFTGESGIFDLKHIGKIRFNGIIEGADIKFENLVVEIENDRVYKVI